MIRLRRFAAALAGLLLVQLTLLGTGFACSAPPTGAGAAIGSPAVAAGATHSAADHAHHRADRAEHAAGTDAPRHGQRGDVPQSQHDGHDGQMHCPTMLACAFAPIAAATSALPDGGLLAEALIAALDGVAPASVVGAPEPPPPRA